MSAVSVRLQYRPIRVGWCVRTGNLDDLRTALRLTHTLWGGHYNPLIPVGNRALASQLVELFRVDVLYPVAEEESLGKFVAEFPHLRWPFVHDELFVKGFDGRKGPMLLDVRHPAEHLREAYEKEPDKIELFTHQVEWEDGDDLGDMLLATFGAYPPGEIGELYDEVFGKQLSTNRLRIALGTEVPASAVEGFTPAALTAYRLERDRSSSRDQPGIYVGGARNFDDLATYWNLRASDIQLRFYDPASEARLSTFIQRYVELLRHRLAKLPEWQQRVTVWSRTVDPAPAIPFDGPILPSRVDDVIWNGLNVLPPLMYMVNQSVMGSAVDVPPPPSLSFQLSERPFHIGAQTRQHCVISARPFSIERAGSSEFTYQIPNVPELNEFIAHSSYLLPRHARVGQAGLGIITDAISSHLTIRAVRIEDLVTQVFANVGIDASPSRPGMIATRLLMQMGGLQGCRVFKIAGVRSLVERYGPATSFTRSSALQLIGQVNPATGQPQFARYEDLYIEQRSERKLTPESAFLYLLKKRVFRVGLELKCLNCRLEFWLHLDDVQTSVDCEYCGFEFNVTPQLRDRDWRFRRSGLFGKEDHQQGAIPVALTLQQLETHLERGSDSPIFSTGWELRPKSPEGKPCEVDFVVLASDVGGKPQLAIGEAKTNDEITEEDVRNLISIADAFPEARFDSFIVFSKTGQFSDPEKERCRQALQEHRHRVIMLSGSELEPYFIFEESRKKGVQLHTTSLEGLASFTHQLYFEPPQMVS